MTKIRPLLKLSMFIDDNNQNISKINKQKQRRREERIKKTMRNIRFFDIDIYSPEFDEIFKEISV